RISFGERPSRCPGSDRDPGSQRFSLFATHQLALRRCKQSNATATIKTTPLITSCANWLTSSNTRPLLRTPRIRTPATTLEILPNPPVTLTPPRTHAVNTSNFSPFSDKTWAEFVLDNITIPAIPAKNPDSVYTRYFTLLTFIPDRFAACSL